MYQLLYASWMWHRVNFKLSLTGLKSENSFTLTGCHTKVREPFLPGRIVGCMPFPTVLTWCKIQSTLFRTWTRVADFISKDDSHCMTTASIWRTTNVDMPLKTEPLILVPVAEIWLVSWIRQLFLLSTLVSLDRQLLNFAESQKHGVPPPVRIKVTKWANYVLLGKLRQAHGWNIRSVSENQSH